MTFGIGAYNSGEMMSRDPHKGIWLADTARTLDLNGGNPACNQGGVLIIECDEREELRNAEDK